MKFSIVMPVYNAEKYLRSAIDSVRRQTFSDWELICVNDGSTDSSGMILHDISVGDARIKVVEKRNYGPGAARNSALEIAIGEWIVFLDADDLLSPWTLEEVAHVADDADAVRFGKEDFEADKIDIARSCCYEQVQYACLDSVDKSEFDCGLWQYAYKRSLIGETRFASYVRGEDKLFQLQYLDRVGKMAKISAPLYYYRQNSTSLTHAKISYRALCDELQWRLDWFRYLRASNARQVDRCIFRRQGIYLVEQMPVQIQSLDAEASKALLRQWYAALPSFRILPFGWMQWLMLRILLIFPKRGWVISLFCKVPYSCRRFISGILNVHLNK